MPDDSIVAAGVTPPRNPADTITRDAIRQARYEDIAYRLLGGQRPPEIAAALSVSTSTVRNICREPGMVETYERIRAAIYGDVNAAMRNERIAPILRAKMMAERAQTALAEVIEEVRARIRDGRARATDLKVLSETSFGVIDRSPATGLARDTRGAGAGAANVTVQVGVVNANSLGAARDAFRESGVDLSDLTRSVDIEARVAPEDPTE